MAYSPLARGTLKEYIPYEDFLKQYDEKDFRVNVP